MTHLEEVAVRECLAEALGDTRFSICGVSKACHVLGLPVHELTPDWHVMNALHCKKFDVMDYQAKVELVETVARVLHIEKNTAKALVVSLPALTA